MNRKAPIFVWIFALLIIMSLIFLTWDINFWPTDAEVYYLPTAVNLPHFQYISQMHEIYDTDKVKWLHGKEMFIVHTAIFQHILNDYKTLRPLILVCILSFGFSGILIFYLIRCYWGSLVGGICFSFFMTSLWPYIYILFIKHQPLGLFYFLLALWVLQFARKKEICYFFSAFCLCLSLYSSTVSTLYVPYYLVGAVYFFYAEILNKKAVKNTLRYLLFVFALCLLGFAVPFIYFNYPNVIGNVKGYLAYARISSHYNHFFYNQPVLRQWMDHPELSLRGGWIWIIKYLCLIAPILFPLYLSCVFYLLCRSLSVVKVNRKFVLTTLGIIFLSLSSIFLAEIKQVAQYGANYFTFLIGMILLIGYSISIFLSSRLYMKWSVLTKLFFGTCFFCVFALHLITSSYLFFSDVYPARMMTTFLSKDLKKMAAKKIYTYTSHPSVGNVIGCLDPKLIKALDMVSIENMYQADTDGFIIVPPITGDSIYLDVTRNTYNDFDKDIFLNGIIKRGALKNYAIKSFEALPSSRIWLHEEEVLSYRAFMLNHLRDIDLERTKVWVLDTQKLWQDFQKNKPLAEYAQLVFNGIRNIGTRSRVYMYDGEQKEVRKPTILKNFVMKMYKVGKPKDGLVAYVYTLATDEPVWIPFNEYFQSEVLAASDITSDPQGAVARFKFATPLLLMPGPYKIVIYRSGRVDNNNFYRVYINNEELTASYMKAANVLQR